MRGGFTFNGVGHFMFTIKNAAYVAIMQVWVIVIGMLTSGLWYVFSISSVMKMPFQAALLFNYGIVGLTIPLTWITGALIIRSRPEIPNVIKRLTFLFGVLVLIWLVIFVVHSNMEPFLDNVGSLDDD